MTLSAETGVSAEAFANDVETQDATVGPILTVIEGEKVAEPPVAEARDTELAQYRIKLMIRRAILDMDPPEFSAFATTDATGRYPEPLVWDYATGKRIPSGSQRH